MKDSNTKVCSCCVMDTTDTYLELDSNGVCNRCREYKQRIEKSWNHGNGHESELKQILAEI